jgi:hypothetical protein
VRRRGPLNLDRRFFRVDLARSLSLVLTAPWRARVGASVVPAALLVAHESSGRNEREGQCGNQSASRSHVQKASRRVDAVFLQLVPDLLHASCAFGRVGAQGGCIVKSEAGFRCIASADTPRSHEV